MAPSAPVAAALSNKLFVDNDHIEDQVAYVSGDDSRVKRNTSGNSIRIVSFTLLAHML